MARKIRFPEQTFDNRYAVTEEITEERTNNQQFSDVIAQRIRTEINGNRIRDRLHEFCLMFCYPAVQRFRSVINGIWSFLRRLKPLVDILVMMFVGLAYAILYLAPVIMPFLLFAGVFLLLGSRPLTYYHYIHDAKPVPVVCSMYDSVRKKCIHYSQQLFNLVIDDSELHFKRPPSFYPEYKCYVMTWDKNSDWDYTGVPCYHQNGKLVVQMIPAEFYDGATASDYFWATNYRPPRIYIEGIKKLPTDSYSNKKDYRLKESATIRIRFKKIIKRKI